MSDVAGTSGRCLRSGEPEGTIGEGVRALKSREATEIDRKGKDLIDKGSL